jgi:hypothetical protein
VVLRAGDRCEYCRLAQAGQAAAFHVDHVLPVVAGGPTIEDNLALACVSCSLRKGARTETIDPDTGEQARIFDPRTQSWDDHFMWSGVRIDGRTPIGRATVDALSMNRPLMLAIRVEERRLGRHPG